MFNLNVNLSESINQSIEIIGIFFSYLTGTIKIVHSLSLIDLFFRHELAIQALQTGDQDDNSLIEHKKEQDQNLVIENQMVELGLTQQVGDLTLYFV